MTDLDKRSMNDQSAQKGTCNDWFHTPFLGQIDQPDALIMS